MNLCDNYSKRLRQRSISMNSRHSSSEITTRSISCEELPKPVCRKHSKNYYGSNFNLFCGTPTSSTSPNGSLHYHTHLLSNNGLYLSTNGPFGEQQSHTAPPIMQHSNKAPFPAIN